MESYQKWLNMAPQMYMLQYIKGSTWSWVLVTTLKYGTKASTLIQKSGDQYSPADSRAVGVNSTLGKLFNRILNKRILNFLTQPNTLSRSQAGFMPKPQHHIKTCTVSTIQNMERYSPVLWILKRPISQTIGEWNRREEKHLLPSRYHILICGVKLKGKRIEHFWQARQGCSLT